MATKPKAWIEVVKVAENEKFDLDWHDRVLDARLDYVTERFSLYVLRREGQ